MHIGRRGAVDDFDVGTGCSIYTTSCSLLAKHKNKALSTKDRVADQVLICMPITINILQDNKIMDKCSKKLANFVSSHIVYIQSVNEQGIKE